MLDYWQHEWFGVHYWHPTSANGFNAKGCSGSRLSALFITMSSNLLAAARVFGGDDLPFWEQVTMGILSGQGATNGCLIHSQADLEIV
jgi:hypothetical protein